MKSSNKTIRALLLSVFSLLTSASMLIGTTFAWFTDSVTSSGNTIVAGMLDIVLEMYDEKTDSWIDADGKMIPFVAADGRTEILWEPNCTYKMAPIRIRNVGNLATYVMVSINGVSGDEKLLEAIEFSTEISNLVEANEKALISRGMDDVLDGKATLSPISGTPYGTLLWDATLMPKGEEYNGLTDVSDTITFLGHMKAEAGNEYQNLSIEGISITVLATQSMYEEDSFSYTYDRYSQMPTVTTAEGLIKAIEEGGTVVLSKNITLNTRVTVTKDVTINLNGYKITCTDKVAIDTSADSPATITIDGRIKGSTIEVSETGGNARAIQAKAGSTVNVLGGTYIGKSNGGNGSVIYAASGATLNISDATVIATETSGTIRGFSISSGATATITNCEITATTSSAKSYGVYNSGKTTIVGCTINAYSNYDSSADNLSQGVLNYYNAELMLVDCYVSGTHSGVQNVGTLSVNGGTYEGYAHGGFYFSGEGTVSYISNATIRESEMPDDYTSNGVANYAGFYMGGNSNITVYMDNCDIFGSVQTIVMRGGVEEQNNSLYISNSTINLDGVTIRVGNNSNTTNRLYLGAGNNFTADNSNNPTCVIVTNVSYAKVE